MKSIWILLLLPVMAAAQKPKEVKLKGNLQLAKPVEQILISYRNGDNSVNDSLKPGNGSFTYKAKIEEPVLATFRVRYVQQPGEERAKMEAIPLYLEPGGPATRTPPGGSPGASTPGPSGSTPTSSSPSPPPSAR
jgi:hypothetical protein